jgi:hypothetical protein
MARCPSCDYPLPEDRAKVGARCPNCKDPLYEPPGRVGRPAREGEGQCPVHPGVETVGTCRRCGNYLCEVCRTRWREFILCAACVQRALDAKEAAPELETAQRRQAILSIGLGAGLWGVAIIGAVVGSVLAAAGAAGGNEAGAGLVGGLLILATFAASGLMAVFGIGSGASVLRARGSYMLLATGGLVLSSMFLGGFIGFMTMILYFATV